MAMRLHPHRIARLTLLCLGSALILTRVFDQGRTHEIPWLLITLNLFFLSIVPALVAGLALRAHQVRQSISLILLGSGMVALSVSGVLSSLFMVAGGGRDAMVTTHNLGVLIAAICHVMSAIVSSGGGFQLQALRRFRNPALPAYLVTAVVVAGLGLVALFDLLPDFFVPVTGSTPVRQAVLGAAAALLAVAALQYWSFYRKVRSEFFFWYAHALGLLAVGLVGVMLAPVVGSLTSWVGRAAQYASGIFLLAAVTTLQASVARRGGVSLTRAFAFFFGEAETPFKPMVDSAGDAIASLDQQGAVLFWNAAAERLFGRSAEEVFGTDFIELVVPHENAGRVRAELADLAREAREGLAGRILELELIGAGGTRIPADMSILVRPALGPELVNVAIRDVSDRRDAELALREAHGDLERRVAERTAEIERTNRALEDARDNLEARVASRTAEVEQRSTQLRRLAAELGDAEQRERRRLAQALHDQLQQLLVAAKLALRADRSPDRIAEAERLIEECIEEARSLTIEISPPVLRHGNLPEALAWLAGWICEKHGLTVALDLDDAAEPDGESGRLLLFQAARELLFNVVKHAGVGEAYLTALHTGHAVRIVVEDEGRGFETTPEGPRTEELPGRSGLGLLSLRERVEAVGGTPAGAVAGGAEAERHRRRAPTSTQLARPMSPGTMTGCPTAR
jgi:PAS domain S-box-containing protein